MTDHETFCVDCGAPDPQHQRIIEPEPPQIVELICDNCLISDIDAWDKLTGEQRQRIIDTIDLPEGMR